MDVAETAGCAVQEVVTFARAAQSPRDNDFAEWNVQRAIIILEMQRNLGEVDGSPRGRSLEDYLFHLGAAKSACSLLAQNPAYCVGDVGFAAAVRADDRRHAGLEEHIGLIGERLEAVNLEFG